jgi:hypothetical protein
MKMVRVRDAHAGFIAHHFSVTPVQWVYGW